MGVMVKRYEEIVVSHVIGAPVLTRVVERSSGKYVLHSDYSALESRLSELEKDAARLDSLEDIICASRTGVTIERVRYAEDGYVVESGFRAMKFHAVTELKSTIREAIDELLSREA